MLVTTTDIRGEWSEPVYQSRGFDGSLFHQSNGKKWFLNMLIDHRWENFLAVSKCKNTIRNSTACRTGALFN